MASSQVMGWSGWKARWGTARAAGYGRGMAGLIAQTGGHVAIACDTEFHGPHTLTAQFAARVGDAVVVQVYSSPDVPPQPAGEALARRLRGRFGRHRGRVVVNDGRPITPDLSPALVVADLFGVRGVESMDRSAEPRECEDLPFGPEGPDAGPAGELTVTLVGHFWRADFLRVFGRDFFASLLSYQADGGRLRIDDRKLMAFREGGGFRRADPVLCYAWRPTGMYAVKVRYFDTHLAFGHNSLDGLGQTFLGAGKVGGLSPEEKADMPAVFARDPARAYAYAAADAVLTLFVHEEMAKVHGRMYRDLGFDGPVPPMRSTLGSRVADLLLAAVTRAATGAERLGTRGRVSRSRVQLLLRGGSVPALAKDPLGHFGEQTGQTHGGLLFSRSPTALFHAAPGQFRDVDLGGCYANVMGGMHLYAGRPVVFEPGLGGRGGAHRLTLGEAVALMERLAAPDAWVLKVTGPITAGPNALIPSTRAALTGENYKKRAARRQAAELRQPAKAATHGLAFDGPPDGRDGGGATGLYSAVVEAGVVAHATWLMIRALPPALRAEYEGLTVDTALFYPTKLVAADGPGYDALRTKFADEGTPWTAALDPGGPDDPLRVLVEWRVGDEHAALRFPLGDLARSLQAKREAAKRAGEKAAEKGWKETANSLYGVLASPHLPTGNVVAANVVTATARALAFALQLSLNGVQVITDGCTYRRDQVPAGTLADCLAACPDYPIDRANFCGPYLDPAAIPGGDAAFTAWYREHAKRFFGVAGPEYDALFSLHPLAHKGVGDPPRAAFDALCCDGSSNYVKLVADGAGGWAPAGSVGEAFKARSFREGAKKELLPWVIGAYSADAYTLPPVTEATDLLAYKPAGRAARKALRALQAGGDPEPLVYYPLGIERRRVMSYKAIKASGFVFRDPKQQAAWARALAEFGDRTGCGPELLALRRGGPARRAGSLADVAALMYRMIRDGVRNPVRSLNLNRLVGGADGGADGHAHVVAERKRAAEDDLVRTIDPAYMSEAAALTGLFVGLGDFHRVG